MDLNNYKELTRELSQLKKKTYKNLTIESDSLSQEIKKYLATINDINSLSINKYIEIPYTPEYEISENMRDLSFINAGINNTLTLIEADHPEIIIDTTSIYKKIKNKIFKFWFTDRDGTINNYCSRYDFSFQPLYNAVIISNFIKKIQSSIILTSAPYKKGLKNISILDDNELIIAGSKGREFSFKNNYFMMQIPEEAAICLTKITEEIKELLSKEPFDIFKHIGSGFQEKTGQITVAKQDINNTIPQSLSQEFQGIVEYISKKHDPSGNLITIEDTGKDIEIILNEQKEEFSKGEGIDFIAKTMGFDLSSGNILITGDTPSDIPMVEKCIRKNNNVTCIFVTKDEKVKSYLSVLCDEAYFVSSPDALIYLLYLLS